jgi:16S rRNA (guanine966-N2)-methyltransferase
MFDVLSSLDAIENQRVLDLFAGSGALGIEALSRGAAHVTFVESGRGVADVIEANLRAVDLYDRERVRIVRSEANRFLNGAVAPVDVALIDPPYKFAEWPELLGLVPADLVVLESARPVEDVAPFSVHRSYRYGTTLLTVAKRLEPGPVAGS